MDVNDTIPSLSAAPTSGVAHIDALPYGTVLAEFEIRDLVGVGGFGMVYRAYDRSLQRTVAIKEYLPVTLVGRTTGTVVLVRSSADQATFSQGLKSFVAEAHLLARFDHPSLVKVYRFWEANNTAYMVMPLYQGVTLKQARSEMSAPPPEAWLRKMLWSVLEALEVLHQHNTLHRDVAPDNIFLQDSGSAVLLDLGSARRAVLDASHRHTAVLKVNYAPIEQYADAADLSQGPWTDLYALAALVHGCLCNEPPLPATFRVVRDRMPSMASVAQTVQEHFGQSYSEPFVRAIDHALAIQPGDRPQSVAAFAAEMQLQSPGDLSRFDWRADLGQARAVSVEAPTPDQDTLQITINTQADPQVQNRLEVDAPRASRHGGMRTKLGLSALLLLGLSLVALVPGHWLDSPRAPTHSVAKSPEPEELFIEELDKRVPVADGGALAAAQPPAAKPATRTASSLPRRIPAPAESATTPVPVAAAAPTSVGPASVAAADAAQAVVIGRRGGANGRASPVCGQQFPGASDVSVRRVSEAPKLPARSVCRDASARRCRA